MFRKLALFGFIILVGAHAMPSRSLADTNDVKSVKKLLICGVTGSDYIEVGKLGNGGDAVLVNGRKILNQAYGEIVKQLGAAGVALVSTDDAKAAALKASKDKAEGNKKAFAAKGAKVDAAANAADSDPQAQAGRAKAAQAKADALNDPQMQAKLAGLSPEQRAMVMQHMNGSMGRPSSGDRMKSNFELAQKMQAQQEDAKAEKENQAPMPTDDVVTVDAKAANSAVISVNDDSWGVYKNCKAVEDATGADGHVIFGLQRGGSINTHGVQNGLLFSPQYYNKEGKSLWSKKDKRGKSIPPGGTLIFEGDTAQETASDIQKKIPELVAKMVDGIYK